MSWNPQDPNSQYGNYGQQQPNQNPNDPYSGQYGQQGSQQYGQQSGQQSGYQYDPNAYQQQQQGGYQQPQYDPNAYQQSGYGQQQQQYQAPYGAQAGAGAAAGALGATSMGMQANVAAGLSYVLGWITGIIFFFMEKQNRFVRFNAMQSILFFGGISVLDIILRIAGSFSPDFLGLIFGCALGLLSLVGFVGWIVLMINGFQGKYFKLPIVGDYAERYVNTGKFQ